MGCVVKRMVKREGIREDARAPVLPVMRVDFIPSMTFDVYRQPLIKWFEL